MCYNYPLQLCHLQYSYALQIRVRVTPCNVYSAQAAISNNSIKNVCEEKFLVEDIPDERVYSKYLGKLEWISVRAARLSTKNGEYFVETYE